jgi:hypothetical protein
VSDKRIKVVSFAPPKASRPALTTFHRLAAATQGKASADVTRLVRAQAVELERVENEIRDAAAYGLSSPIVYR